MPGDLKSNAEYLAIRRDHAAAMKFFLSGGDLSTASADFLDAVVHSGYPTASSFPPESDAALFSLVMGRAHAAQHLRDYSHRISSDASRALALSCFAFLDAVFRNDCAASQELKGYRSYDAEKDNPLIAASLKKSGGYASFARARQLRTWAEENLRKGHTDSAFRYFSESLSMNPSDYTVRFQLGLLYFYEKADPVQASEHLSKALALSRHSSRAVYSYCASLLSFIERTAFPGAAGGAELLKRARDAAAECGHNFPSDYALLQCAAAFPSESDGLGISVEDLAAGLVSREPFFAFQMCFDAALRPVIGSVSKAVVSLAAVRAAECERRFMAIGSGLGYIEENERHLSDRLRSEFNFARKEFRLNAERLGSKALFDATLLASRLAAVEAAVAAVASETKLLARSAEVREFAEGLLPGYREELMSGTGAYSRALKTCEELKSKLAELEREFPGDGWSEKRSFRNFKAFSGLAVFACVAAASAAYSITHFQRGVPFFLGVTLVNFAFIPFYSMVCGRIYGSRIEAARKRLAAEIGRYEFKLDVNSDVPAAAAEGLLAKYGSKVSERFGFERDVSRAIFEAVAGGHPERIQRLLPPAENRTDGH